LDIPFIPAIVKFAFDHDALKVLHAFIAELRFDSQADRRAMLFSRLEGRGQVWMTATEAELFHGDYKVTVSHPVANATVVQSLTVDRETTDAENEYTIHV